MNLAKKIMCVLLIIFVFFLGIFFNKYQTNRNQNSAKETASKYITAIFNGESGAVYGMTTNQLQREMSKDAFVESYKDAKRDNVKYTNSAVASVEDKMVVFSYVDGLPANNVGSTKGTFVVGLAKEDGKWKVESGLLQ